MRKRYNQRYKYYLCRSMLVLVVFSFFSLNSALFQRGYSITAAFLIQFNVKLPSLESILSPLIHRIEFQYSVFFLSCLATHYAHWILQYLPFYDHFYGFAQFVHCLTFRMKMSCELFQRAFSTKMSKNCGSYGQFHKIADNFIKEMNGH